MTETLNDAATDPQKAIAELQRNLAERTAERDELLQQQTATADVLKVISRSTFDLQTVFETLAESAVRLCSAERGLVFRFDGQLLRFTVGHNVSPEFRDFLEGNPIVPGRNSNSGRAALERRTVHNLDVQNDPEYSYGGSRVDPYRTVLAVPMLRGGELFGVFVIYRHEVRPFTDSQVALMETFADQAVIAIENTRLFNEVRARTRDLTESLQQQTATSEVLEVISASAGELEPVFQKMLENATRVCGANFGTMNLCEEGTFRHVAFYNMPPAYAATQAHLLFRPHPQSGLGTVARTHQVAHIEDIRTLPPYLEGDPSVVAMADLAGARTILAVPMLRENEFIGTIVIYRKEVSLFADKQISLLTNFANQAVIAIENARLLNELRERTTALTQSLEELRTAQDRLVQTQKLASLGQLTAGIAHEIKNPLNFVNNFSALSAELTDELNDVLKPAALSDGIRKEVDELTLMLKDNLEKVVQHGKRADSIVKNMLLHSREGSGEQRPADINALLDDSLNLAYHGARAEKPGFSITLQRDFDAGVGAIESFPQEITRAFLNLISNGFYAATKRKTENDGSDFEPVLCAATKNLGDRVEVRIRDNGAGIPAEVKDKMFNPFFTTKPAGEGTGLGLSMSHDIIVKQHGGTIDVETEQGQFTEFRIILPRKGRG
jgi:signal transduction histidine kinase